MEILDENNIQIFGKTILSASTSLQSLTTTIDQNLKQYFENKRNIIFQHNEHETDDILLGKLEKIFDQHHENVNRCKMIEKSLIKMKRYITLLEEGLKPLETFVERELPPIIKQNNDIIEEIIPVAERVLKSRQLESPYQRMNDHQIDIVIEKDYENFRLEIPGIKENKEREMINRHAIVSKILSFDEMKQIEEWTNCNIDSIVFDSTKDDWSMHTSIFDEKIKDKDKLVIIIEDSLGNKFGSFIMNRIKSYRIEEYGQWSGERIRDSNTFIFSLQSNGRYHKPIKFPIKFDHINSAFSLYSQDSHRLFNVGKGYDICIMKKDSPVKCYCQPLSFNYIDEIEGNDKKMKSILRGVTGKEEITRFDPKSIVVIQMKENEETKLFKREKKKRENKLLNQATLFQMNKPIPEIQQIIEWFPFEMESILFDSEYCDWNVRTSLFNDKIIGKDNILILIEDTEKNSFGYFQEDVITNDFIHRSNDFQQLSTTTNLSFIFSYYSNDRLGEPSYFKRKLDEQRFGNDLQLYEEGSDLLLTIGNGYDICLMKNEFRNYCSCKQKSFHYSGGNNLLVGERENNFFTVKRIRVFQLKKIGQIIDPKEEIVLVPKPPNPNPFPLPPLPSEDILKKQIIQLEEVLHMKTKSILFDSRIDDWNQFTSVFDEKIVDHHNVAIIINDIEQNVFGCYLHSTINTIRHNTNQPIVSSAIIDRNAFLFKIHDSENDIYLKKYPIRPGNEYWAFTLYDKKDPILFTIGGIDICVYKHNHFTKNYCNQTSFYYKGDKYVLIGRTGSQYPFTTNLIRVVQFEKRKTKKCNLLSHIKEHMNIDIRVLHQYLCMDVVSILFDSAIDNWNINTSIFDKRIIGKKQIIIVIETFDGYQIGCFINSTIEHYQNEINGKTNDDDNAFVFSLNQKIDKKYMNLLYPIIKPGKEAFILFKPESETLFSVGKGNDICVKKKEYSLKSSCTQMSFDYKGKRNCLIGREGPLHYFNAKRILVFQMKPNRMMIEERNEKKKKDLFERQTIERWTKKTISTVLFDSTIHNWNINSSLFDQLVFGKEHLIFVIEDINNNCFGAYINSKIDKYQSTVSNNHNGNGITDNEAFVFSLDSLGRFIKPRKFDIHNEAEGSAFSLYDIDHQNLFTIGEGDIVVKKQKYAKECSCKQVSFNYKEYNYVFVGQKMSFEVQRIRVFQMN